MGLKQFLGFLFCLYLVKAQALSPWKNDNQLAYDDFKKNAFAEAKKGFHDKAWKASSAFRDKDYDMAIKYFKDINSADGFYNLGNAYAFKGNIDAAIKSYEKAIQLDNNHLDAKHNLQVLKKYQSKQQQDKQQQDKQEQDKQQQDKQEQDKQEQDKQQQDKQQQDKQQQDKQQQDKQQQDKQQQDKQQQDKQQLTPSEKERDKDEWMKFIQEDPAGLLRQKFRRDYQRAQEQGF